MIPRQNCAVVCFCPIYLFTYVTYLPVLLSSAYTSILCRLLFTCLFICFFMLLYRIYYNKILNEPTHLQDPFLLVYFLMDPVVPDKLYTGSGRFRIWLITLRMRHKRSYSATTSQSTQYMLWFFTSME